MPRLKMLSWAMLILASLARTAECFRLSRPSASPRRRRRSVQAEMLPR